MAENLELTAEDEEILDEIWDEVGEEEEGGSPAIDESDTPER